MKEFSLPLANNTHRPILKINGINALLDTGNDIPTFSMMDKTLYDLFHAKKLEEKINVNGLGGLCKGDLFTLEMFQLGDLIYPNIKIFRPETFLKHPIILSSSMFEGLVYKVDTKNKIFTVTIPDDESNVRIAKIISKDGIHLLSGENSKNP